MFPKIKTGIRADRFRLVSFCPCSVGLLQNGLLSLSFCCCLFLLCVCAQHLRGLPSPTVGHPQESHYDYFSRRLPGETPEHRKAMQWKTETARNRYKRLVGQGAWGGRLINLTKVLLIWEARRGNPPNPIQPKKLALGYPTLASWFRLCGSS